MSYEVEITEKKDPIKPLEASKSSVKDLFSDLWNETKAFEGTAMQIEKALINDRLRISKLSWKSRISTIYNFAVIYPWNLLFS